MHLAVGSGVFGVVGVPDPESFVPSDCGLIESEEPARTFAPSARSRWRERCLRRPSIPLFRRCQRARRTFFSADTCPLPWSRRSGSKVVCELRVLRSGGYRNSGGVSGVFVYSASCGRRRCCPAQYIYLTRSVRISLGEMLRSPSP